ncbi:MAG: hypothetical protein ACOX61_05150 [Brooklawnia sp.]
MVSSAVPTLELYGLASRITLELTGSRSDELRPALETVWSRCLKPIPGAQQAASVSVQLDDPRPDKDPGYALAAALQRTTQDVTHSLIKSQAGRLLMFHGGACADPNTGATVAYVAAGGMGKTTLSRLLGRQLGYITDETVGITLDGGICPYPKPLSIRPALYTGLKRETSPDDLGLLPAPANPWLRSLVLLRREDDHVGPPVAEELDLADAIVALAPESSSLSSLDKPLHLLADLIERIGPVRRWHYSEAEQLAPLLAGAVAS